MYPNDSKTKSILTASILLCAGLLFLGLIFKVEALPLPPVADLIAPVVTEFTIPSTVQSLIIPITAFTATDAMGVTGYLINESSATPSVNDLGWSVSAPITYSTFTSGSKTLYAWAKDAAGNISSCSSNTVTITLPVADEPTTSAVPPTPYPGGRRKNVSHLLAPVSAQMYTNSLQTKAELKTLLLSLQKQLVTLAEQLIVQYQQTR